jgi:hypothetical protein
MSQDDQTTPSGLTGQPDDDPAASEHDEGTDPEHRGDFAEGTRKTHVAPGTLMGDFAAGQEAVPRTGTIQPKGDFASGEGHEPGDPAALRGDFARGQEHDPRK